MWWVIFPIHDNRQSRYVRLPEERLLRKPEKILRLVKDNLSLNLIGKGKVFNRVWVASRGRGSWRRSGREKKVGHDQEKESDKDNGVATSREYLSLRTAARLGSGSREYYLLHNKYKQQDSTHLAIKPLQFGSQSQSSWSRAHRCWYAADSIMKLTFFSSFSPLSTAYKFIYTEPIIITVHELKFSLTDFLTT